MNIHMQAPTAALVTLLGVTALHAQSDNPQPTCKMCPGTYIPAQEIQAYITKAVDEKLLDQQVRDVDIGKANIAIGLSIAKSWTLPHRTLSLSTIRSAKSITSSKGQARWSSVPI